MAKKEDLIAVCDSGVGGISVLRALLEHLPGERFCYYGDSANAPYGVKSSEEVRALTLAMADNLMSRGVKALVVACNTATAAAIGDLRERYPDTIVVGIEPAVKLAADRHPGGHILVMATDVTLREKKLAALMHSFENTHTLTKLRSPGLVELIEAGKAESPECEALLRSELEPFMGKVDAIVLGCTHYPFVRRVIRRIMGDGVELVDGSGGTARETLRRLREADLLEEGEGSLTIENSACSRETLELACRLLEAPLD